MDKYSFVIMVVIAIMLFVFAMILIVRLEDEKDKRDRLDKYAERKLYERYAIIDRPEILSKYLEDIAMCEDEDERMRLRDEALLFVDSPYPSYMGKE